MGGERKLYEELVAKWEARCVASGDDYELRNFQVFTRAAAESDEVVCSALDKFLHFIPEGRDPEIRARADAWCAELGMRRRVRRP
jgi:hypothetical protein